ncbi:MAG TPA: ABC transporter permease [Cyclobacteriaceae bacterium]
MQKRKVLLPKRALRFLRWFCTEDCLEEIEGDLTEIFEKQYEQSPGKAKRKFTWSVITYFRPEFIKSFNTNHRTNTTAMFRHNFLISYRNFMRYKSSFLINLIGLSTGLACALLIYLWVYDEMSIDQFHEKGDRLYQVLKNTPQADGTVQTLEYTPSMMAQTLAEDFPEVEYATSVHHRDKGSISVDDKQVKAKHIFADKNFFIVFSYKLLEGSTEKSFADKYGVLLSDQLAIKLFGTTENVIGKTITWEWWDRFNGSYIVSGIFETPPSHSSFQFDLIFTHTLWADTNSNNYNWVSNNANTYLVLKKGTDAKQFAEKVRDYSKAKYEKIYGKDGLQWEGLVVLQRYVDHYLYGNFENGVQTGGKIQYVRLFSIIAIFILVIACINFMNLSTARASRRMKEVGIKKVVGAQRSSIIVQHISESIFMTGLSLMAAALLVYLLLPPFKIITGKEFNLTFDSTLLLFMAGITILTGLVSGSYPALYLSGFRPAVVLKGLLKTSAGESWIRQGLVVFQFVVSVTLIVSVVVVFKQIQFIQAKNLGYDKENIITFTNEGKLRKSITTFLTEVKKIPGVVNASSMMGDLVGNNGGGGGIDWEGKDPNDGIEFSGLYIDYELIEMLGLKMEEGRTFSDKVGSDRNKVIFNATAIDMMKLKDPVGKNVNMWGEEVEIVGVVKDFHYESLYQNVGPLFLRCSEFNGNTLIKIKTGEERKTIDRINKFYESFTNGLVFDYHFLDQDFETLYAAETRVSILSKYFAGIAVLISCLGLFGLANFTAERRIKEIGIRKILGCSELGIVRMLSGDFTKMVLLSIIIALPLSYFIANRWLESFAYRIDLKWWFFIGAGLAALIIAWLTVGLQTVRAARANPTECLKME